MVNMLLYIITVCLLSIFIYDPKRGIKYFILSTIQSSMRIKTAMIKIRYHQFCVFLAIADCAAAKRAIGTRKGEHET